MASLCLMGSYQLLALKTDQHQMGTNPSSTCDGWRWGLEPNPTGTTADEGRIGLDTKS